jgi:hypothetical protein
MTDNNLRPHILIGDERPDPVVREYSGGGGGGSYSRSDYNTHSSKVSREAESLKAMFANLEDQGISKRYFRLLFPDGEKVSTTSSGGKIEEDLRSSIIGSPSDNIAHLSTSVESFDDLNSELGAYGSSEKNVGKSKFSIIEGIGEIPLEEKVTERFTQSFDSPEETGDALISLFPDLTSEEEDTVLKSIDAYLKNQGGELLNVVEGENNTVIKVMSKRSILEELAKSFVSIQSLDSADVVIETQAIQGEDISNQVKVNPNTSTAFAAFFDSGVNADSRFLKDSILDSEYPFGDAKGVDVGHGSFVASRIIYGDTLKDQISRNELNPDVRALSVCLNGFSDIGSKIRITTDEIIGILRKTVIKWHKQIRVYNLSMSCIPQKSGLSPAVKDDMVHTLAAEIDALCRKYDVIFVICSGNFPYPTSRLPTQNYPDYFDSNDARIMPPGESMLGITVGSIAKETAAGSMAQFQEPSPFTRRGPGFGGYRKPDLVAHGGNKGTNWSSHDFLMAVGLHENGDSLAYGNGTSYSAPIVTRFVAKLFELMPIASACLVKAMALHFSETIASPNIGSTVLGSLMGNGFITPEKLSHSNKHEQTFLHEGELDFREMVTIPFYVPKGVIDRPGRNKVKIRATISLYPETNALLKSGYCKSHIRTKIVKKDANGTNKDVSFSGTSTLETTKYSSIIKMEKVFSSHVTHGEWGLFIAHESRWKLKNPKTKYAVVLTVEDPRRDSNIDIYNLIRTEVPNKYQNEIQAKSRIMV